MTMASVDPVVTPSGEASSQSNKLATGEVPSGFILKLFQMVNGAPDEVISWTSTGDAFIIGSDIKRLESETLPMYFRHNRFQSLVRQLNFYSFRKINRERNVWIYKHSLFHRDRPDDLHMVRRRTCPGLDGRKQRFSRFSARKINQSDSDSKSDDDESSVENQRDEKLVVVSPVKRQLDATERRQSSLNKRARRSRAAEATILEEKEEPASVDSSLLEAIAPMTENKPPASVALVDPKRDRIEMMEQSLIVSEVAHKLDEFVRKAMKGKSRTRKGSTGIVTPPYGNFLGKSSPLDVLTYDDEICDYENDENDMDREGASLGDATQTEESSLKSDDSLQSASDICLTPSLKLRSPPVEDQFAVEGIAQRLMQGSPPHCRTSLLTKIAVASFCMSTAPSGDDGLCSRILQLIASSGVLMAEFQSYRAALHPLEQGALPSFPVSPSTPRYHASTIQQIWERTASRSEAVRDFKIFAVNCIQKILGRVDLVSSTSTLMSLKDRAILKHTADLWQESTGLPA